MTKIIRRIHIVAVTKRAHGKHEASFFCFRLMGKMLRSENWVRPRRRVGTKIGLDENVKGGGKLPIFKLGENDFVVPVPSR